MKGNHMGQDHDDHRRDRELGMGCRITRRDFLNGVAVTIVASLLPAGIVKVEGRFDRGDIVAIHATDGRIIARGLSNYAADVIERIRGKKTAEVRATLGDEAYDEVVHRDNLVAG